jgi:methylenetetrahydrofolate dehydrogenase (NADP+) / methenyltetrahydrofolate cyclohydrolase
MSATIVDGNAIAIDLRGKVSAEVRRLTREHGLQPGLAVVLVGDNPASHSYVRSKSRALTEVGMRPFDFYLPTAADEAEIVGLIQKLNADALVNGILVQLPLPPHINPARIIAGIDPDKDVDGFHPLNAGRLMTGLPGFVPCTPLGCLKLIKTVHRSLLGLDTLMIGRSNVVGNPLSQVLLNENATVTVAHTHTRHLPELCGRAELLCVAIGCAEFIRGDWIKPGATVIDIGINRVTVDGKSRLVGDVNYAEALEVAGAITPVPGGVGPMTIACLLVNTLAAARIQAGLPPPAV